MMLAIRPLCVLCASVAVSPAFAADSGTKLAYPETQRIDHTDTYHGTVVPDPYRWLEDDVRSSKDVENWVERENAVTFKYLESLPNRETIKNRLTELWNFEKYYTPWKKGGHIFFFKNNGLQNQNVLHVQDSIEAEPRVLIDPNTWSSDGTVALTIAEASRDGKYLAYGVAEAGSDWQHFKILEIATGKILEDEIRWVKYSGVEWDGESKGLYYSRYDEPKEGAEFQSLTYNQKVYYHKVGTPQSEDTLIYERPDHPDWGFNAYVSDDGVYLILSVWIGTDERNQIFIQDISKPGSPMIEFIDNFDYEYLFVGNDGPSLYFKTSLDAPNRRLVALDVSDAKSPREIIPQQPEPLIAVSYVNRQFVAHYLKDAKSRVSVFDAKGQHLREIDLPGIGSVDGLGRDPEGTETFYLFHSYATPPSTYRYDMLTGKSTLLRQAKVDFKSEEYVVEQVFFESKDATRVPMFITHKKNLVMDGANPTLLYGYGGFNIPETPAFSISRALWMVMGGVYAVANLRGGGEYGEAWHKAGTKLQKQNVFDDFIAAAEYLINSDYCSPETLAIAGGSNGGLLVGAAMTQRPELFGVALPAVGVMDMLRFHQFTAGRFWTDDYGSADNADEFKALYAYSPYHNLNPGVEYPATLVTTADTDDRVVPGHSFKFAAALQRAQAGPKPVLIRIETRAGHGAGKPTTKRIEEIADQYAFALANMELD